MINSEYLLRLLLVQVLLALCSAACEGDFRKSTEFPKGIDKEEELFRTLFVDVEFNTSLELRAPSSNTSSSNINLLVVNTSDKKIIFPYDFNVRILTFSEEATKWIDLDNNVIYMSKEPIVFDPNGTGIWAVGTSISPNAEGYDLPMPVRIVVVGRIIQKNIQSSEEVGAFIDLAIGENQS
jgi:hypothetical protein